MRKIECLLLSNTTNFCMVHAIFSSPVNIWLTYDIKLTFITQFFINPLNIVRCDAAGLGTSVGSVGMSRQFIELVWTQCIQLPHKQEHQGCR